MGQSLGAVDSGACQFDAGDPVGTARELLPEHANGRVSIEARVRMAEIMRRSLDE